MPVISMREQANQVADLVIVTGLSGAGKSTALRVFEDLRYFAIDGLPCGVMAQVAAIMPSKPMQVFPGLALGVDVRQDNFFEDFKNALKNLEEQGFKPRIIFIEASSSHLMRRYAATRRPHPLETRKPGLETAIAEERQILMPVRNMADIVIDSTGYSIHDLRRQIQRHALATHKHGHKLAVKLLSFGFKNGIPQDADFVFDLRYLANPYFVEGLKNLSGKDKPVADYVFSKPEALDIKEKLLELLFMAFEQMEREGRYRVTVALGCTGGKHRSVAFAEAVAHSLLQADYPVALEHKDLNRPETQGEPA